MLSPRHALWVALGVSIGSACSLNDAGLQSDAATGLTSPDADVDRGSGGIAATGGSRTGGTSGSGGVLGSGGAVSSGGRIGTGGVGTGGSGTGGALGTGGAATGGRIGTGGTSTGGAATGGSATGGSSTGGAATGGTATGGSSTGGAGTGGGVGSGGVMGTGGRGGADGGGGRGTGGSGSGGAPPNCGRYPNAEGFVTPTDNRGHCYWFHPDASTWPAARTRCQSDGGDLVTIHSEAENQFVRGVARFTSTATDHWIGGTDGRAGNDVSGPGTYRWVTNETWAYTNWNATPPKQPDGFCDPCNNGQPCTCDHRATLFMDGTWFDYWEDNPRGFLCEAVP